MNLFEGRRFIPLSKYTLLALDLLSEKFRQGNFSGKGAAQRVALSVPGRPLEALLYILASDTNQ